MATDMIPSASVLAKIHDYQLYTSRNTPTPFSSILRPTTNDGTSPPTRVLVIFIRHFFCGNCQQYLLTLMSQMPPSSLPADLSIAIIGCGAPSLIDSYIDLTSCPWPIYADPSTKLYDMLGMYRTLSLGMRSPEYIKHSLVLGCLKSVRQGLARVGKGDVRKAGDLSVNGGEFLFVQREGKWEVPWCHRMMNSRNHTEVEDLRKVIDGSTLKGVVKPQRRATTTGAKLHRSLSQKRQSWVQSLKRSSSTTTGTFRVEERANGSQTAVLTLAIVQEKPTSAAGG